MLRVSLTGGAIWRMCVVLFWLGTAVLRVEGEKLEISMAAVSYAYAKDAADKLTFGPQMRGVYGLNSKFEAEHGRLVHVITEDGANHACSAIVNAPPEGRWIALVQRGQCKFHSKIHTASKMHNASAVIVYDNVNADPIFMSHNVADEVSIFLNKSDGERLARLVDSGLVVTVNITLAEHFHSWLNESQAHIRSFSPRNNTMLITLLTFVGLLIFGLVGLLAYAARRSQYVHKMNRPRMVFTLQEAMQAQENLLPSDVRTAERPAPRPRPGPPPSWQPRWMPDRTLSTIPEDQHRSLEQV